MFYVCSPVLGLFCFAAFKLAFFVLSLVVFVCFCSFLVGGVAVDAIY